ncbi:MAG: hypothetical protein R2688_02655 [Fimbriimonadaceae bacterium]
MSLISAAISGGVGMKRKGVGPRHTNDLAGEFPFHSGYYGSRSIATLYDAVHNQALTLETWPAFAALCAKAQRSLGWMLVYCFS